MARGYPDFEGQKSKLLTVADWAALEATDKNIWGLSALTASGNQAEAVAYTVPAGKTLYVTQAGFGCIGGVVAEVRWHLAIDDSLKTITGGVQASSVTFPKPFVVAAGEEVEVKGVHISADILQLSGYIAGYEL